MASARGAVLGSLLLSAIRPGADPLVRRAVGWARDLDRLGIDVPLPVVHDLGILLAAQSTQWAIGPRRSLTAALSGRAHAIAAHARYVEAIRTLAAEPTIEQIRALRPSDDLVVVLLGRLLGAGRDGRATSRAISRDGALEGVAASELAELERLLPAWFAEAPRDGELAALDRFVEDLLRLRVVLDTIDLDTLELLSVFGQGAMDAAAHGAGALSGLAQVELFAALSSLQANDVVNFSLELLPSVLETTRRAAPGTYAVGGYQGLTRRGSLDSMVLTELAWDDDELARRLLDDEVLFHARERSEDEAPRVHLVLVDASASMRGDRTTFARGVAIALVKRLELEGEEARIRFFDSRLYEPFGGVAASSGRAGGKRGGLSASLPHILAFRGEHGRSPERVLRQLVAELDVLRTRDRRSPVVHLITHASFYAPRSLVQEVRARAAMFGVFITPRVDVEGGAPEREAQHRDWLDWLDVLDGHFTVDQATLGRKDDRAARGREIVRAIPKQAPAEAPPASIRAATIGPPSSRRLAEPEREERR
ncbi:MAG: hypothetical protein HYV09_07155 [Deltaproteobacteria bacterium]|nr:hypothetical protein [Deltaproteobacteria bacterium]